MLGGCLGGSFLGSPAFEPTPDTPENRLNSGFDEPTCEMHFPEYFDEVMGTALVGGAVAVAAVPSDQMWGDRLERAAGPLVIAALFYGSAAWVRHKIATCRAVQRTSDAQRAHEAARTGDCATVRSLELRIRQLQLGYYQTRFLGDPAVRRCLGLDELAPLATP
jgi:hypothetical protein